MKKAIAAILTDTHLAEDNREVVKGIFLQAIDIVKSLGLTQLDHGGDIFHSRKGQLQVNLSAFRDILNMLQTAGIKMNQVVGNHDKTEYSIAESFLDPYEHNPALKLFRFHGSRVLTDDITLFYCSYFTDDVYKKELDELIELIGNVGKPNKSVLLTHIGVTGAVMNSGIAVESGITPSLFEPFDLTLIGHYHDGQILAGGRIRYIGASLQHNFGELLGKGLTVLYDDLTTEVISLKYPQYIKYEVAPGDLTKTDIEELRKEKSESGDNIRVELVGTDAAVKSFNKQILEDAGISVKHKLDTIDVEELENRVEAFDVKSLKDEFEVFCLKNNLDVEQGMKYFKHIITT